MAVSRPRTGSSPLVAGAQVRHVPLVIGCFGDAGVPGRNGRMDRYPINIGFYGSTSWVPKRCDSALPFPGVQLPSHLQHTTGSNTRRACRSGGLRLPGSRSFEDHPWLALEFKVSASIFWATIPADLLCVDSR